MEKIAARCALSLIHLGIWFVYMVLAVIHWLKMTLVNIVYKQLFQQTSYERAAEDSKVLTKIPRHLCIVMTSHKHLHMLPQLSAWSFICGVKRVTILAEGADATVINKKLSRMGSECRDGELRITTLAHERSKFMRAVHNLKNEVDIDMNRVDMELKKLSSEEADVVICIGPYYSTYGLSPWDIRLSEIFYLPENRSIFYDDFIGALKKFSKCNQRLGK